MTRLPGLDQLPLVVLQFAIDQKVFARPTGALFRGAIVIPDSVFDPRRADLDFPKLLDKRALIQVGDNGLGGALS